MIKDEKWPVARLIPISSASGVEAQERRLASALLAVMSSVPEFGYALLKPLGAPVGRSKRSSRSPSRWATERSAPMASSPLPGPARRRVPSSRRRSRATSWTPRR